MRRLLTALLLVLLASPAWGVVGFDSVAVPAQSSVQPPTLSTTLTLIASSNMAAHVTVHTNANGGAQPTISSVTVGGVTASVLASSTATLGNHQSITYCAALGSATGAQTVNVNVSGAGGWIIAAGAMGATGVDQTTPCTNGTTATSAASPVNITVSTTAGDLTFSAIGHNGTGDPAMSGTGTTRKWVETTSDSTGGGIGGAAQQTWTTGGLDWAEAAVTGGNFKAAGATAGRQRTLLGVGQ
jgi:hypothetical protein